MESAKSQSGEMQTAPNRPSAPNRRHFLASSGAALAISALHKQAAAMNPVNPIVAEEAGEKQLFDISLAQWSLHRSLRGGKMDNLDFAKVTKEKLGIHALEYVNQFFMDKAEDQAYLGQMKQRAADLGVTSVLIMIDGEGAIGDADKAKREKCVNNHKKWVNAAKFLGCHSIRVNAQSAGTYQEQVGRAADGLAKLSEFAAQSDMNVIVENHGGLSSNGQWLAQVIQKVGMDNCGTLPDFGNFTIKRGGKGNPKVEYDRYLGMAALMPFAKAVSAKSRNFDDKGNETNTDFEKMLTIMLDAGYTGYVGVEYEGNGMSEFEGVLATKKLLERCREKLTASRM